jgi:hypothetical protein
METFWLKLVVTPVLIAAASLAGRRWGQAVSGWFVGLPLTSGPIAFFVALDHGAGFAAAVAVGALAAAMAEAAFCLAYAHTARRAGWPRSLAAACVAFGATAAVLQPLALPSRWRRSCSSRWPRRCASCRAAPRRRPRRRRRPGICRRG